MKPLTWFRKQKPIEVVITNDVKNATIPAFEGTESKKAKKNPDGKWMENETKCANAVYSTPWMGETVLTLGNVSLVAHIIAADWEFVMRDVKRQSRLCQVLVIHGGDLVSVEWHNPLFLKAGAGGGDSKWNDNTTCDKEHTWVLGDVPQKKPNCTQMTICPFRSIPFCCEKGWSQMASRAQCNAHFSVGRRSMGVTINGRCPGPTSECN